MIDMKKQYKTRCGLPVEILTTTAVGLYWGPVVGLVKGYDSPQVWGAEGQKDIRTHKHDSLDLVEVKPVREGWVNIYSRPRVEGAQLGVGNPGTTVFHTRDQADYWGGDRPHNPPHNPQGSRIACIKIQFSEGEGLE